MKKELLSLLEYWEKEKGVEKNYFIESLEKGLLTIYRKKAGLPEGIKIKIDPETGEIKFINEKGEEIPPLTFPGERIAAQIAKQILIQRIREAEKNAIYQEFKKLEGTVLSGTVERFEDQHIVVSFGKAEGLLPRHHKLPGDHFKMGDPIKVYLLEVRKPTKKNHQLILSRTHPNFVKNLLINEVPELKEGIVKIKEITRFPGDLTKVAVYSDDKKIDPVGTCIGDKATRIKGIMKELGGEKIEIIKWDENIESFILNSLSPAKCEKIILQNDKKQATVLVDDSQIYLAIGKKGQNVRIASKLTGWNIRVYRTSEYSEGQIHEIYSIKGIEKKLRDKLIKAGYSSIESLKKVKVEDLVKISGIGEKKAKTIIEKIEKYLKEKENESL